MSVVLNEEPAMRANVVVGLSSQESDAALVDAARRRDPAAFKELMKKYGARVFRIAIRITRNHEDAEEVSQDAFARAFLHLDTFRGDSRFYTWLVRIAINQSLMKLRKRRGRELEFDGRSTVEDGPLWADVTDDTPTPEQRYAQEELHGLLASAIAELPMSSREVLHLRDVEEHSTEETARMLGLSVAAVKSRTRRGRNRLREELTKHFAGASSPISPAMVQPRRRLLLGGS
jgi:RNA polymerase sigma-70 factor (ECF subfamily)